MFWSKNKKKKYTPVNPSFFYIKVGCKGVFVTRTCFRDGKVGLNVFSYTQLIYTLALYEFVLFFKLLR